MSERVTDLTTLAEYLQEKQEYKEISRRDVVLMSMSLFIPFCLLRGLSPFTTFMASQQPWNVQAAASLNGGMSLGIIFAVIFLPLMFVSESMRVVSLGMNVYGAIVICLEMIPRFNSIWFHGLLFLGRLEFGWSISTMFLVTLAVLKRHPINENNTRSSLLWIDFFYALSSISFVFFGMILQTKTYHVLFGVWAACLLVLPFFPLYLAIPKNSFYDPLYNNDEPSMRRDYGKCYRGFQSIYSDWRSIFVNLTICINAFCMNVFLTDLGLHLRIGLNQSATNAGVILLSYCGGSLIGHIFNRSCKAKHETVCVLSGSLMLLFFTTIASNPLTNVGDSLNMVIGVSFFIGLSYQMLFYQSFLMSYEYMRVSSLKEMSVLSCLMSYGIGAMVGDYMSVVIWNAAGWNLVTTVLAACSMGVVVLYVLLSVVRRSDVGVVDEEETRQLLVGRS